MSVARPLLAVAMISGCVEQPTGIRVHVETDLEVPRVLNAVRLRIAPFGDAGVVSDTDPPIGLDQTIRLDGPDAGWTDGGTRSWTLPITVGVIPWRDSRDRVVIVAEGSTDATECVLDPVKKSLRFEPGVLQDVYIELAALCCVRGGRMMLPDGTFAEQCPPGQTCGFSGCGPATDDPLVCIPGPEACNGQDDDCDGADDEDVPRPRCGVGSCARRLSCGGSEGWTECVEGLPVEDACNGLNDDCDGADLCDPLASDCDGRIDEGVLPTWWPDADADGRGNPALPIGECEQPPGTVTNADDCDDGRPDVFLGAAEVCDGVDQDCDAMVDDGVLGTWWTDGDGDGYGDAGRPVSACSQPPGTVTNTADCNDSSAAIHPGAADGCNDVDEDCDGSTLDEACPCPLVQYGAHTYAFCSSARVNWSDAVGGCSAMNRHLVTIEDAGENAFVGGTANSFVPGGWWWIGLYDRAIEGTFVWWAPFGDGCPPSGRPPQPGYRSWSASPRQPDNDGNEDCVATNQFGVGVWNDDGCFDADSFYVCEGEGNGRPVGCI